VAWGVVAVLLCVLWVRSYRQYESIARNNGKGWTTILCSTRGTVHFVHDFMMNRGRYILPARHGEWMLIRTATKHPETSFLWDGGLLGESRIIVPNWLLVTFAIAAAFFPWIRHSTWRFSLRTLLIATTLIAVVLGVIVWAAK
jgi:hypothetical protein